MEYLSKNEIEQYVDFNRKYFGNSEVKRIKELLACSNVTLQELETVKYKSPIIGMILSLFLGIFGIDRIYCGNYVLGVFKMATSGFWFIGWIVDWFFIAKRIKTRNYDLLYDFLHGAISIHSASFSYSETETPEDEIQNSINELVGLLQKEETHD